MPSIDLAWYGVILGAIFSILQLIYPTGGGDIKTVELKIVALCASMSLITLASCKPLPSSNGFKIAILFAILAFAILLSAAVPSKLWWVPYFSCVRPLFELLRDFYLFCSHTLFDHLWKFCVKVRNAGVEWKRRANEINQPVLPISVGASSPSSLVPEATLNREEVVMQNNEEPSSSMPEATLNREVVMQNNEEPPSSSATTSTPTTTTSMKPPTSMTPPTSTSTTPPTQSPTSPSSSMPEATLNREEVVMQNNEEPSSTISSSSSMPEATLNREEVVMQNTEEPPPPSSSSSSSSTPEATLNREEVVMRNNEEP